MQAPEDDPAADSNWAKARSSFVWLAALAVAFGSVWWIEHQSGKALVSATTAARATSPAAGARTLPASPDLPAAAPQRRPLTAQEQAWAQQAWRYFERNTDPRTGLAGAVDGYPSGSLWDIGSQLQALLAARDLGLLAQDGFDARMARALDALARLPLHRGALPNKTYDVRTLAMTDYRNQPAPAGTGWSALDLARLVVALHQLAWQHPQHTVAARAVLARWDLAQLVRDGRLWGWQAGEPGAPGQPVQEGRLGYEQYGARALALLGLDTGVAADALAHLRWQQVEGIAVPADDRDAQRWGAQAPVVSEPWLLLGLELGWGPQARELAWRVWRAQEERTRRTAVPTAASEDHLDRAPYFAWHAVWDAGRSWVAVDEQGREVPQGRTLSTKAAFAWHALLRTDATARLVQAVDGLADAQRGWAAGRYEEGGQPNAAYTANTNAVVLESLAYIVRGPLAGAALGTPK